MKLSIVMPVFNEKATLREIVDRVLRVDTGLECELIAVDDFSTDGTRDVLKELSDPRIKVFFHEKTGARGPRCGRASPRPRATSSSSRTPTSSTIRASTRSSSRPSSTGGPTSSTARASSSGPHRVLFFWHSVGNRLLTTLSNILTNLNLTDMETCYKVFKREILAGITLRVRTGSASSPRYRQGRPAPGPASTRSRSPTPAGTTPRARRSAGRTASPPSGICSSSPSSSEPASGARGIGLDRMKIFHINYSF